MEEISKFNTSTKNVLIPETNDLPGEKYHSCNEIEKWTKKFLDAKIHKEKIIRIFGMPKQVRPPFQEFSIVRRYYGPSKYIPTIYRAEQIFPSSEGIPQI